MSMKGPSKSGGVGVLEAAGFVGAGEDVASGDGARVEVGPSESVGSGDGIAVPPGVGPCVTVGPTGFVGPGPHPTTPMNSASTSDRQRKVLSVSLDMSHLDSGAAGDGPGIPVVPACLQGISG
jgi:hypothetical protein